MSDAPSFAWLPTGAAGLRAMLAALGGARRSAGVEGYIIGDDATGRAFRDALAAAAARGVRTRLLVDAWGSLELPDSFWAPARAAGVEVRWVNPLSLRRGLHRDHRKLVVVDDEVALLGGFNFAASYDGDGVRTGWRDLGLELRGPAVAELGRAFHAQFGLASYQHRRLARFRRHFHPQRHVLPGATLYLLSPGRGRNPLQADLVADLGAAREIQLVTAYLLPPRPLRRALTGAARRGARVRLILPGRSDVPFARLAARALYARLMRAGLEVYEYEPAVLHSKLYVTDRAAYAGSANLDIRSLNINYELAVRLDDPRAIAGARELFADHLARSRRIDPATWGARGAGEKLRERLAHWFLARLDPLLAAQQRRWMLRDLDTAVR
ncbi:MAG TPA: phosphatidylserine/phosphatidylglycerophosphate/cardiolipin synthase family protein [Verrucomicrobiota bacterium]|nr:phosphatidylserine/phosphatidylglycerophosphate/cardiolipin synthase family protein [Verrucomicrobiota bacterium]